LGKQDKRNGKEAERLCMHYCLQVLVEQRVKGKG